VANLTKAFNWASRIALLDLILSLEQGLPLPSLNQGYFQDLLSVLKEKRSVTRSTTQKERIAALLEGLPKDLLTPLSFSHASLVLNEAALKMATMASNSVVFRLWPMVNRSLRDKIREAMPSLPPAYRLTGYELNGLVKKIIFILKNPKLWRQDYGFPPPYDFLNNVRSFFLSFQKQNKKTKTKEKKKKEKQNKTK